MISSSCGGTCGLIDEGRPDLLVEMHADDVDRRLAVAGKRAGDRLVQRHAEGVEIGARVDAILLQHLGGHVVQRPADLPVEHLPRSRSPGRSP